MAYMIKVSGIKGTDLPNIEKRGEIDPYVVVEYLGVKKKTEVKENELNPTYGEVLEFDLSGRPLGAEDTLSVSVMDHETFGRNRLVGTASMSLRELTKKDKRSTQLSATLVDGQKRQTSGKISFNVEYIAPAGAEPAASGADDRQQAEGGDADADEDADEDEFEEEAGTGGVDAQGNPVAPTKKRRRKKRRARVHNLPDKDTEFQVRVKVIEARQLPGANISPVCRITVAGETKQTRVRHSTNKPYFDETFFFNFTMRPNELFDELVHFEVFNSKKLRSDALLGSFHCDVGLVYNEDSHALVRKWILLTCPEEAEGGEKKEEGEKASGGSGQTAGYLKVNAVILGPGDELPDALKGGEDDDNDDIESNLLRPAGATLRPATFLVKIYRGEDIPQMDTAFFEGVKKIFKMSDGEKELVDPYVKFRFAGQKAKTDTHMANANPEFNQELRIAFKFPSMCERMKLQMFDWDRVGNDDCIGTAYVPLSAISGSGDDGFLPSFGPCFVNFYGSTREFSDLPDEYDALNLGQGEGVAYRGRLLVEIDTRFGDHAERPVHDIMAQELVRVQTYLRRRKFKLFATFMSATMISETDGPVEFEVSIGNYGNKLDVTVPPMASSTPPTNPVFDGSNYYYLPWDDTKPCCDVDCHWEDIYFRLRPLNILLKIVDRLEKNMKKVEISVSAKAPAADTAALLIALLEQIIIDCRKQLPLFTPDAGGFDMTMNGVNELDLKVQDIRREELNCIVTEASSLREQATDVDEAMDEINSYLSRLKDLCTEPQNSMPDVVIWMISGTSRIAYHRIPANEILFNSDNPDGCGRSCSKLLNVVMKYPGKKGKDIEDHPEIPALVRVMLWLGLEGDKDNWTKTEGSVSSEGEYSVLAETYENEVSVLGFGWTSKVPSRPSWSNGRGDVRLNQDAFVPPSGWEWEGEWFIDPELSLTYEADSGHKTYLEDAFENESRYIGGNWGPSTVPYTDVRGDQITHRDEITAPNGWEWTDDWRVDVNRAVDEDGFEYCVEATVGGWGPVEKTYHLCRRRRWARNRVLTAVETSKDAAKKVKQEKKKAEGWEFAPVFGMKFHSKERKTDLVRRRRWHRKMVMNVPGAPAAVFQMPDDDKKKPKHMISPRMFLDFEDPHIYQLRAYIYQARDVLGKDSEGVSDPYAKVSILHQSDKTVTMKQTVSPKWDQTLIFDDITMYGPSKIVSESPPSIIIELFDKDQVGKDEYLGRCVAHPVVKLHGAKPPAARLLWYPIKRGEEEAGQLLAAFELFLAEGVDLPFKPKEIDGKIPVPSGIAPVMIRTGIEVLSWGVRNMKKYQLSSVSSPQMEFEVDGNVLKSSVIKNTSKNPNFENPVHFFDILLPKEELYAPPMNIRVLDNRSFGRKPLVGRHTVKSLMDYIVPPVVESPDEPQKPQTEDGQKKQLVTQESSVALAIEEKKKKKEIIEETVDWWSKYFASCGQIDKSGDYIDKGYDLMKIYNKELEEIEEHGGLTDFVQTFHLQRGKDKDDEDNESVGEFKGLLKVYPLPPDKKMPMPKRYFSKLPPIAPMDCIVRVYIIKAIALQPQDPSGKADPYLVVELGKQKISDKENRLSNTINPIFGRMFEMKAKIPVVKDLKIKVMDYDYLSRDDVIGQTVIDLENRVLTSYRATCGLPKSYHTSGVFQWKDSKSPKEILAAHCQKLKMDEPVYVSPSHLRFNGEDHMLTDYEEGLVIHPHLGPEDQRLALHVLNKQPLVREHIETRSIYNPLRPNTDQGQLEMWVDIFPSYLGAPGAPVNIIPRQPQKFELRIIIWNTADVKLDETSITGEQMSDIYVKGWMAGVEEKQKTDIHYRSLDGEGNFNWRFIFPFEYLPAEKVMVIKEKEHFWSADETEERLPPKLLVQIWDNDKFSSDDFIGSVELSVSDLPRPTKTSKKCGLHQIIQEVDAKGKSSPAPLPTVDLFQMKRANGWWPLYLEAGEVKELTGKVEMTVELLSLEEAEQRPAGPARDDPNLNPKLEEPNRPATSFLWFTSPWKTLKYIIWRNYKWYIIGFFIFVILALFIVLFFYSVPGTSVRKIFGA